MQRPPKPSRLFFFGIFLAAVFVASSGARAAGFDFTIPFSSDLARHYNTATGAADGQRLLNGIRLVPTGVSNYFLGIDGGYTLRRFIYGGGVLEPTDGLDLNDWPMSLAYDSNSNRAVLVTLGGEGFLYQRPANAEHWSVLASMQNEDLDSMVYFPPQNAFWGLRVYYGSPTMSGRFLKYSAAGQKVDEFELPAFPVNITPGDHTSELVAVGDKIVMLVERKPDTVLQQADKSRIYVIDPAARSIQLTYEGISPVRPEIYFTSPSDFTTNNFGESIDFHLIAKDPNKDIGTIVFRDNGVTAKQWTLDPAPNETNVLDFAYTPAATGLHILTAIATDAQGLTGESQSLHVTVLALTPPPALVITSPLENAQIIGPTNILLSARATNGTFAYVNFYLDSTKGADVHSITPVIPQTFSYIWSNAPAGEHTIKVVGVTSNGFRATSAPVHIKIISNVIASITVTRDLPDFYLPGQNITVSLAVRPNASVNAWAIEEQPPADWTISEISFNGSYDAVNQKIKWGAYTDHTNITLTYKALPPSTAAGAKTFTGVASANGKAFTITGDLSIVRGTLYHPADISPQDARLTVNEVTAYAAAWKSGANWNYEPIQIPIDYVTRAGYLWRAGETYTFNAAFQPPTCWVPSNNLAKAFAPDSTNETAVRILSPANGTTHAVTVTLRVRPPSDTTTYAVEEMLPPTWRVANLGGASLARGMIRFGPFYDSQARDLTYSVTPMTNAIIGQFQGQVSCDGSFEMVQGGSIVFLAAPKIERGPDGKIHIKINAAPGEQFTLESSAAIDGPWQTVTEITGADTPIELPAFDPPAGRSFYRLRPPE
jgi:hypothetical protein